VASPVAGYIYHDINIACLYITGEADLDLDQDQDQDHTFGQVWYGMVWYGMVWYGTEVPQRSWAGKK
jgi:hypothetical protein